jgi:hypothetical protein
MSLNRIFSLLLAALISMCGILIAADPPAKTKEDSAHEVTVLPIFFVPQDEVPPTPEQATSLMRHLEWAQTRYRELLRGEDTFALSQKMPLTYKAEQPLKFYRGLPEAAAPQIVNEMLAHLKSDRTTCNHILLVVMMNPHQDFPPGGGRSINGGFNTGGGIVVLSSYALEKFPNFQSTVQHEIGHSFGLPHVNAYGYSMKTNDSIMGYNPAHHTKGFTPSATPGILIPEDLRGLGMNKRVFPHFKFDPAKDVPSDYSMKPVAKLGPIKLPE